METFWIRPKLYFGPEPLEALSALAGKRVLIVTDAFLASSGLLDRVKARLTGEVSVFDRVEPDPSLRLVAEGVRAVRTFRPEAVVAFGGGSPMDCAKAMCWFSGDRDLPLYCIPTTAGTGSEVTSFAVLTDTDQGVKYPLVEDGLLPEGAILEPAFLDGVPPKVTADTGMDVLTHAAEAAAAVGANPFTDALAESAFALAWRALPRAYQGDRAAKAEMLYASWRGWPSTPPGWGSATPWPTPWGAAFTWPTAGSTLCCCPRSSPSTPPTPGRRRNTPAWPAGAAWPPTHGLCPPLWSACAPAWVSPPGWTCPRRS